MYVRTCHLYKGISGTFTMHEEISAVAGVSVLLSACILALTLTLTFISTFILISVIVAVAVAVSVSLAFKVIVGITRAASVATEEREDTEDGIDRGRGRGSEVVNTLLVVSLTVIAIFLSDKDNVSVVAIGEEREEG